MTEKKPIHSDGMTCPPIATSRSHLARCKQYVWCYYISYNPKFHDNYAYFHHLVLPNIGQDSSKECTVKSLKCLPIPVRGKRVGLANQSQIVNHLLNLPKLNSDE